MTISVVNDLGRLPLANRRPSTQLRRAMAWTLANEIIAPAGISSHAST